MAQKKEDNIVQKIGSALKQGFDAAGKAADTGLNKSGEGMKGALDFGAKVVTSASDAAGNVVGKERVEGAITYGTIGAGVGSIVPGKGTLIGSAAGAALGFLGGKTLLDFHKKVTGQEVDPPPSPPQEEPVMEKPSEVVKKEEPKVPDVRPPTLGDRL